MFHKVREWAVLACALGLAAGNARAAEWFVATNGSDLAAGTNWATAKRTIQAGVDAAASNDTVWISNGVYATGGRTINGSNRVAIVSPVTVQSVNGPEVTIIQGAWDAASTNGWGAAAMRCAYVGPNATLSGFTLTNGATLDFGGGAWCETAGVLTNCVIVGNSTYSGGGGVYQGLLFDCILSGNKTWHMGGGARASTLNRCTLARNSAGAGGGSVGSTLNDCLLVGNMATDGDGGGSNYDVLTRCTLISNSAYRGGGSVDSTLNNCVLVGNSAINGNGGGSFYCNLYNCTVASNRTSYSGGGSYQGILSNCTIVGNAATNDGGGAYSCTLNKCSLIGNSAGSYGGGACVCALNNCVVISNKATMGGGGSRDGTLNNCTVSGNTARSGGGSYLDTLNNCIVYYNINTALIISKAGGNHEASTFNYCCTTPDPGGVGNITDEPQFVDAAAGDYRLKTNSPCIDQGSNAFVQGTTDLDGNPRILNGIVDMGAYETQLYTGYRAWAAAITNGLTNDTDCAAGDGVPNLLRYAAGSSPTEPDDLARVTWDFESGLPTLVFNRNPDATDVTLVIQGADEMSDEAVWRGLATNVAGSWGGAANVSESGQGSPVACTVQDLVPFRTNRFLRLMVTRP